MNRFVRIAHQSYPPIAVFSPYNVRNRIRWWKEIFPAIAPYYAIKSMNHPYMLDACVRSGILGGFDVASAEEVRQVRDYNLPIIHSNPVKTVEDIEVARDSGVELHVCDDVETIHMVRAIQPDAKIVWRIKSMEGYSRIRFNEKFGASVESTARMLESVPTDIYGISFHVGSSCSNMRVFPEMLRHIKREIFPIWSKNKSLPKMIDIGGGFKNVDSIYTIREEMGEIVNEWNSRYGIQFIAEPGRYISDESISLYTKVIAVKYRDGRYDVYINDSIYQSFSCIPFDKSSPIPVAMYLARDWIECTIWGNTCDSGDKIIKSVRIPRPEVGDVLRWDNMGAYTIVSCTGGFNGFPAPTILNAEHM